MNVKQKILIADDSGINRALLMEILGVPVSVVIGEYTNMKITTPEDLPMAEAILKAREAE